MFINILIRDSKKNFMEKFIRRSCTFFFFFLFFFLEENHSDTGSTGTEVVCTRSYQMMRMPRTHA